MRELAGQTHSFAHNGWLPGILEAATLQSSRYTPVGETDSEQAFCGLLDRLAAIWSKQGAIPPLEYRLDVISAFAAEVRDLGPANFLYSDGDALFAHGDRRKSPVTGKITAPGLVFLQHQCLPDRAEIIGNGVTVTGADQIISLVASVPLTAGPWQAFAEGEVIAFRAGQIGGRSV